MTFKLDDKGRLVSAVCRMSIRADEVNPRCEKLLTAFAAALENEKCMSGKTRCWEYPGTWGLNDMDVLDLIEHLRTEGADVEILELPANSKTIRLEAK